MLKGLAAEYYGLVLTALVLPVALPALGISGPLVFTVVTAFILKVKGYLFVAIKTEALLRPLAERPVALRALVLVFRVSRDNGARHEEAFYIFCLGLTSVKNYYYKEGGG